MIYAADGLYIGSRMEGERIMSKYVFGVDVGGTTVKMGLFTAEGELLDLSLIHI